MVQKIVKQHRRASAKAAVSAQDHMAMFTNILKQAAEGKDGMSLFEQLTSAMASISWNVTSVVEQNDRMQAQLNFVTQELAQMRQLMNTQSVFVAPTTEVVTETPVEIKEPAFPEWQIKWKRGPRPSHVISALERVNTRISFNGRISWPKDSEEFKARVKDFLILADYEGVNIWNTYDLQRSRYFRVYSSVNERFQYKELIKEMFENGLCK